MSNERYIKIVNIVYIIVTLERINSNNIGLSNWKASLQMYATHALQINGLVGLQLDKPNFAEYTSVPKFRLDGTRHVLIICSKAKIASM